MTSGTLARSMSIEFVLRALEVDDLAVIHAAFAAIGWDKPIAQYQRYLDEQRAGHRDVRVAVVAGEFAGYVTLSWQPTYPPFVAASIPEIQDLNVLPRLRRRGIGSALLDAAESRAAARVQQVGIRVGLDGSYGAAQRLYVRRGYVPDGRGLCSGDRTLRHGEHAVVDDDLLLCFTKRLRDDAT